MYSIDRRHHISKLLSKNGTQIAPNAIRSTRRGARQANIFQDAKDPYPLGNTGMTSKEDDGTIGFGKRAPW